MFSKNKDSGEISSRKIAPSVISSDVNLLGNIISDGLIDFDGNIHGNIQCHTLVVRKNARIHGEIKADSVQVAGMVKGTIQARSVLLQTGAEVEGIIMHEAIIMEEGATVDGKLKKIKKSPAMLEHSDESLRNLSGKPDMTIDQSQDEDTHIMEHIRLIAANE